MKKFLVTTDFSQNSKSAIQYALCLGRLLEAEVEIFNSYDSSHDFGNNKGQKRKNPEGNYTAAQYFKKKLDEFVNKIDDGNNSAVNFTTTVVSGEPVTTICKYVKEKKHDLIIMGAHGENKLKEFLFGSTSVDVMKKANTPVLAIPPESTFSGIKKIVYASNLEEKDVAVVKQLCDFAHKIDAEVEVFHAFDEDNMTAQEEATEFNDILQKAITYPRLIKDSKTYINLFDSIIEVIQEDLTSLIVLRDRKKGILSRLFGADLVKHVNHYTTVPLLTYNDNSIFK